MSNNLEADVLLRQAWAVERAGRVDEAVALFSRIVDKYPNTDAAQVAQNYLAGVSHLAQPPSQATREAFAPSIPRVEYDAPHAPSGEPPIQRVTVVDLDISFGQLVSLFVKASIALIPAAIILGGIAFVVAAVIAGIANA